MPKFSAASLAHLETAHPDLQRIFYHVIRSFDCVVLEGVRSLAQQEENVRKGVSKTLESKHLRQPDGYAHAVDVTPYPINWNDRDRMYYFAGHVKGVAEALGIRLRWGGDWDSDTEVKDQTFFDLPHFELAS